MAASPADGTRSHAPAPIFFLLQERAYCRLALLNVIKLACLFFLAVYTFLFLIFFFLVGLVSRGLVDHLVLLLQDFLLKNRK